MPQVKLAYGKYATKSYTLGDTTYQLSETLKDFPVEHHELIAKEISALTDVPLEHCVSLGVCGFLGLIKNIGSIQLLEQGQEEVYEIMKKCYFGGCTVLNRLRDSCSETEQGFSVDCNSLYPFAMCFPMPVSDYKIIHNPNPKMYNTKWIKKLARDGEHGYYLDIDYEVGKVDYVSEYPLTRYVDNAKHIVVADCVNRTGYVDHYYNIQNMIRSGYKIKKINRILRFRQAPILREYMTKLYNARSTVSEPVKPALKLMLNSIFGMTCVKPVKSKILHFDTFDQMKEAGLKEELIVRRDLVENGVDVEYMNEVSYINSPIHIAITLLAISRSIMTEYFYKHLKPLKNFRLLMTRTDSFYFICDQSENFPLSRDFGQFKLETQFKTFSATNTLNRSIDNSKPKVDELIDKLLAGELSKTEYNRFFAESFKKREFKGVTSKPFV